MPRAQAAGPDSLLAFRKDALGWTKLSEQAFTAARALPYQFAEVKAG